MSPYLTSWAADESFFYAVDGSDRITCGGVLFLFAVKRQFLRFAVFDGAVYLFNTIFCLFTQITLYVFDRR